MLRTLLLAFLCALSPLLLPIGCTRTAETAEVTEVKLSVEGMTWIKNCATAVRLALEGVEGVESVNVDFEGKTATCKVRGVSAETLAAAVPERFPTTVQR